MVSSKEMQSMWPSTSLVLCCTTKESLASISIIATSSTTYLRWVATGSELVMEQASVVTSLGAVQQNLHHAVIPLLFLLDGDLDEPPGASAQPLLVPPQRHGRVSNLHAVVESSLVFQSLLRFFNQTAVTFAQRLEYGEDEPLRPKQCPSGRDQKLENTQLPDRKNKVEKRQENKPDN